MGGQGLGVKPRPPECLPGLFVREMATDPSLAPNLCSEIKYKNNVSTAWGGAASHQAEEGSMTMQMGMCWMCILG